ncbi:MAG: GDP-mannose 4,6-dehydratase [Acidobacteria bacterium]|nr:GDP-mannose 4,6-dehydratase [Acidobacteriota bacterium]
MATYLITGGAGFIGSHLAEKLLAAGDEVIVLDDLSSGRVQNLEQISGHASFRFVQGCITDRALLAEVCRPADTIFHLAATVGVLNIIKSPVETIENNINGTQYVLEAAVERRTKVIVASTSEVYGKSNSIPFREDDNLLLGPTSRSRWSYAASKIVDEFLALAFWRERSVPTVVARLFNTIGPRQSGQYGMVVPRFVRQALRGEDLTVYGDGSQSRVFTYVGDTVEWLARLAKAEGAVGEVVNLGGGGEVTIAELARRIIELTGSRSKICSVPYEQAYEEGFEDIQRRVPDTSKAQALTGYSARTGLDEALKSICDWCTKHPEA